MAGVIRGAVTAPKASIPHSSHRTQSATHSVRRQWKKASFPSLALRPVAIEFSAAGERFFHARNDDDASAEMLGRRECLTRGAATAMGLAAAQWLSASPAMAEDLAPKIQRYFKTTSGATVEEVLEGQGDVAAAGDVVTVHYVCRRSNGYFVASTIDPIGGEAEPIELALGSGQVIQGLEEAILGMRQGGKRRVLVPPTLGYVQPELQPQPQEYFRQRALAAHMKEPLIFEVQVLKVKGGRANVVSS
eukprot:TRINITY_DN20942_c0_g1_i2.p1 TRINITY_DN20942_c0_g1~~TRINITY_DN20942_c0_g1_i2.p1  ORF type:complete len:257 (-),score=4.01 TRINITY_DN20942_c0_g1_i2:1-741(-)